MRRAYLLLLGSELIRDKIKQKRSGKMVQAGVSKIGWIGTGVMGKSMAGHLMSKGHSLMVFNRTASKADELVAAGA